MYNRLTRALSELFAREQCLEVSSGTVMYLQARPKQTWCAKQAMRVRCSQRQDGRPRASLASRRHTYAGKVRPLPVLITDITSTPHVFALLCFALLRFALLRFAFIAFPRNPPKAFKPLTTLYDEES